jgi:hypothetical protein
LGLLLFSPLGLLLFSRLVLLLFVGTHGLGLPDRPANETQRS